MAKTLIPTANPGMAGANYDSATTIELLHGDIPPVETDYAKLDAAAVALLPQRLILRGTPVLFTPSDRSLTFPKFDPALPESCNAILVHDIDLDSVRELDSQGVPTTVQLYRGGCFNAQAVGLSAKFIGAVSSGSVLEEAIRVAFDASDLPHRITVKQPAHRNLDV